MRTSAYLILGYTRSIRNRNEDRTPCRLLCAVAYSPSTRGLPERSSIPNGGVTATWDAACYSLSHKSFRLIRRSDLPIKRQKSGQAATVPVACQKPIALYYGCRPFTTRALSVPFRQVA